MGQSVIRKENVISSFEDLKEKLARCRHQRRVVYKNRVFYENARGLSSSQYLLEYLYEDSRRVPKSVYNDAIIKQQQKALKGIHTILRQGYYAPDLIPVNSELFGQIDAMLKYWSDEAMRLRTENGKLQRTREKEQ